MTKQMAEQKISKGTCYFCRGEFAKNKMTVHLQNCKARLGQINSSVQTPQRLFHIAVEGKYRPEYWIHLEMPAQATLANLDEFLRAIWVECCGHLSEFTIDGAAYSASHASDWEIFAPDDEEEDEAGSAEEINQQPGMEQMAKMISQELTGELHADLSDVPVEKIEEKLVQMFTENLPPGMSASTLTTVRPFLGYMAQALHQGTLAEELEEFESGEEDDESIDLTLDEVLTVGKKFSYLYDFGSSTELTLKVLAEREGTIPPLPDETEEQEADEGDEDDAEGAIEIIVMARNEQPALVCHICGKPATSVESSSEHQPLGETAFCADCAQAYEYSEELLPLVNSPRTGVCGYTGDEEWSDEDWEEDEEDEE
ncbi:MAG TPA: hypothetical protein VFN35_34800 [Ktedonobacteraceae bacterium]|nr:hypothetical protein [Ktedonobacteraceae bacterium]